MEVMTIGTIYLVLLLMEKIIRRLEIIFVAAVVLLIITIWLLLHNKEGK